MKTYQQQSRINEVLSYIHRHLNGDLSARHLASIAAYSEPHFHRLFRQHVGESVHEYVRRQRLEFAANQLMFEPQSTVADIAARSGFESLSSFSRVFVQTFSVPPGRWRKQQSYRQEKPYLADSEIAEGYRRVAERSLPKPKLLDVQSRRVAYVRHRGYDRSIGDAWQLLLAWVRAENLQLGEQIGLHHSNPALVPLEDCRYVACVSIDRPLLKRGRVSSMELPAGLHAVFRLEGQYGELLPYLSKIMDQWLPTSGFQVSPVPAFVIYHRNHFIDPDERFELDFYLPLAL